MYLTSTLTHAYIFFDSCKCCANKYLFLSSLQSLCFTFFLQVTPTFDYFFLCFIVYATERIETTFFRYSVHAQRRNNKKKTDWEHDGKIVKLGIIQNSGERIIKHKIECVLFVHTQFLKWYYWLSFPFLETGSFWEATGSKV